MNPNTLLIDRFYSAFQRKDFKEMQNCYGEPATFSDAVFQNLNSAEVKAMWKMLCINGKDLHLEFKNVWADDKTGRADWVVTYSFSSTRRKVTNRISAEFEFENGSIIRHKDRFDFYLWARQAFGITGLFLGWTPFFKSKVQLRARNNLNLFMARELNGNLSTVQ